MIQDRDQLLLPIEGIEELVRKSSGRQDDSPAKEQEVVFNLHAFRLHKERSEALTRINKFLDCYKIFDRK